MVFDWQFDMVELCRDKLGIFQLQDVISLDLADLKLGGGPGMTIKELTAKLATAEIMIAVPAEIQKLREKLGRYELPVPVNAKLQQLENDLIISMKQLENRRLTATQDLTWALINSPSFLFNR